MWTILAIKFCSPSFLSLKEYIYIIGSSSLSHLLESWPQLRMFLVEARSSVNHNNYYKQYTCSVYACLDRSDMPKPHQTVAMVYIYIYIYIYYVYTCISYKEIHTPSIFNGVCRFIFNLEPMHMLRRCGFKIGPEI